MQGESQEKNIKLSWQKTRIYSLFVCDGCFNLGKKSHFFSEAEPSFNDTRWSSSFPAFPKALMWSSDYYADIKTKLSQKWETVTQRDKDNGNPSV